MTLNVAIVGLGNIGNIHALRGHRDQGDVVHGHVLAAVLNTTGGGQADVVPPVALLV